jgi:hypothetical protein
MKFPRSPSSGSGAGCGRSPKLTITGRCEPLPREREITFLDRLTPDARGGNAGDKTLASYVHKLARLAPSYPS